MKLKKKKKPVMHEIGYLKMSSGRIVTDPDEINRLLKAEGFTISEGGKLGIGPKLRSQ